MSHRYQQNGFTMIELVAIMVIIAIMAAVAIPRFTKLSTYSLTQSTNELVEAIRFAQETSMVQVDTHYQIVTGGSDKYRVRQYDLTTTSTSDITNPLSGSSPFVADNNDWSGITLGSANLSFDNRGYPCASAAPCNAPMTNPVTITLSDGTDSQSITVEPITGYAYVN